MENDEKFVVLELIVSDPVESAEPGRFVTRLTHPSLTGFLELSHGEDREIFLAALGVDHKQIDPVGAMFKGLRELSLPK